MLKSCWDCLVGDAPRSEEPYSVQLNGSVSRAPPWPTPQVQNEKMYLLPKKLEPDDRINVNCETMNDPGMLRIGLVTGSNEPDYSNLACQLEMYFPPQNEDKLVIAAVQNGQHSIVYQDSAQDYYEGTDFNVEFRVRDNVKIDVFVGASHLSTVPLSHDIENIRFLMISGDINKVSRLDFQFG